ncbi:MAG: 3-carboxy-cis,cis-muconate cycloisomerase [Alphaproteobacteria bacterium]|nr:3-carboxy-cis,cis-muconate cycloisomerase [Alphaproteobacteria bacterium]
MGGGLFDHIFAGRTIAPVFSDAAHVQGMLDFEAALAQAEAKAGVIPQSAVKAIVAACDASLYDLAAIGAAARDAGNTFIPLQAALAARVATKDKAAAGYVHWGATSQDAIDTGLVLQLRTAFAVLDDDLATYGRALARLARKYRATPMAGRTWMQQALPVTFGLKAATWLDAALRHRVRLREIRPRVLALQFGGAAGTLASLGSKGPAVARNLGRALRLPVPDAPWHGARDRVVEAGLFAAALTGSLGKMARDVALMAQTEMGEVAEPAGEGRGGSSAMPQKRNPVSCAAILANAGRTPGLAQTLLAAMPQENERGLGGWHAEWAVVPELFRLAGGALEHAVTLAEGMEVFPDRMAKNLAASGGQVMAESVKMALARKIGQGAAHAAIRRASGDAVTRGTDLRTALLADAEIAKALTAREIDRALAPENYLGSALKFIDGVLARRGRK